MRTPLKTLMIASALVAGIATAPALYAQSPEDTPSPQVSPTGHGNMMGHDNTMGQGNKTDQGNKTGMMKMMGQMSQMMKTHDKMMQTMMDAHGATQPDKE